MATEKRLDYQQEKKRLAERLKQYHDWHFTPGVYEHSIFGMAARLLEVDAVEVVRGEWLDGYAVDVNGEKVYDSIDCSECEEVFKIESHDREYWKGRFKACPFCGARMDGERRNDV